jgi:hypothetical protein
MNTFYYYFDMLTEWLSFSWLLTKKDIKNEREYIIYEVEPLLCA